MGDGLNGRSQGGVGEILPLSASVGARGHPMHVWAEDGRWKLGNYEEKQRAKWPKWQKPGRRGRNIASVSYSQLLRTSVDIRSACGRKTEDGRWGITRENRRKCLNSRNQGGVG